MVITEQYVSVIREKQLLLHSQYVLGMAEETKNPLICVSALEMDARPGC